MGNFDNYEPLIIEYVLAPIHELCDRITVPFLKGCAVIAVWLVIAWFVLYFLGWQTFANGFEHWIRNAVIVGIWILAELINVFGHWIS